ncbi:unnamed protein product [Acanthocheilonema viteae]|uniref:Uncharacterized protein n=1 Tax=Acanthocheilonema viteae TaxID=6277 RepID=A0A498S7B2_ACAVI|nr:unnamed protein product [Acanthocheilonema viteae]
MGERYQHWLQIFKQLNEHSPTKEDIELIAPLHIKEEYFKLHPPKRMISKLTTKVKLKRSFDGSDCLPEPVLKKHPVDMVVASGNETLLQTKDLPLLRRSPRKHPSSSLFRPTTPWKISSSLKPATRRSLTNVFKSDIFQNGVTLFLQKVLLQSDEQILRRSPRKHPSSYSEVLLSPQKPLLLSQPIVCSRLSSLLGSVSDIENEKESFNLSSSNEVENTFELVNEVKSTRSMDDDPQESINIYAEEKQQPFLDEKECLKRKVKGKNENYRRLKMKKSYVRSSSLAKKNFRKWRRICNKR